MSEKVPINAENSKKVTRWPRLLDFLRKLFAPENGKKEFPVLSSFDEQWRLKFLLVKAGIHPAGEIDFEPTMIIRSGKIDRAKSHDTRLANSAVEELKRLGLAVNYITDEDSIGRIFFSNKVGDLEKLMTARRLMDEHLMGEMYGIPLTAVNAYPDNILSEQEIPEEIRNHPLYNSLMFAPSKTHYLAEWLEFVDQIQSVAQSMPKFVKKLELQMLIDQVK